MGSPDVNRNYQAGLLARIGMESPLEAPFGFVQTVRDRVVTGYLFRINVMQRISHGLELKPAVGNSFFFGSS